MPSFRGIDISILAPSEVGQLPEYPHPEGASVQLDTRKDTNEDPSQVQKMNPMVSVYIPSVPGSEKPPTPVMVPEVTDFAQVLSSVSTTS